MSINGSRRFKELLMRRPPIRAVAARPGRDNASKGRRTIAVLGLSVLMAAPFATMLPVDGALAKPVTKRERVFQFNDLCGQSQGTFSRTNTAMTCCWPGWGCLVCPVSGGDCEIICDSAACARQNGITRGEFSPGDVAPPRTLRPFSPERIAPGGQSAS